jgi:hypothetical protein
VCSLRSVEIFLQDGHQGLKDWRLVFLLSLAATPQPRWQVGRLTARQAAVHDGTLDGGVGKFKLHISLLNRKVLQFLGCDSCLAC